MKKFQIFSIIFAIAFILSWSGESLADDSKGNIRGELRKWHKVTIDFTGPETSENAESNPFTDYRLDVTFRNGEITYTIPGYYAADGNAAETGAASGNVWRVHFCPDKIGRWTYDVRFTMGTNVAVNDGGKSAGYFDECTGYFEIKDTDKTGRDHRGKGRLQYVNKHHLQFAENGEYFLKCGADAPENIFAYADFDGDFKSDGHKDHFIKTWEAHIRDWNVGDPTWQGDKGKGLIGAINYLASKGMNAFSFLTMNIDGDDRNVFPYINYDERTRFDCSKLDQWEIVFEHGDKLGMYLHFKLFEVENQGLLDNGDVGPYFKIYCREIIARFAHHLALNWNVGEENSQPVEKRIAKAQHLSESDPYHHHIVVHNGKSPAGLLGDKSKVTGYSLQTSWRKVFQDTKNWLDKSSKAGKPWVVASDEQNSPSDGVITDEEDYWHDGIRKETLWGNLMAGGGGVEYYFGYSHPHSDLTCQDFRSRDHMWDLSRYALEFFRSYLPFWEMKNDNSKISNNEGFCFYKPGGIYSVYLKNGGSTSLDLSDARGSFQVQWYNPRSGGALQNGTIRLIKGGAASSLGKPPADINMDWAILVQPADPSRN